MIIYILVVIELIGALVQGFIGSLWPLRGPCRVHRGSVASQGTTHGSLEFRGSVGHHQNLFPFIF